MSEQTIDRVQLEIEASAKGVNETFDKIERKASALKKALSGFNTSEIANLAKKLSQVQTSLNKINGGNKSSVGVDTTNMTKAENNIKKSVSAIQQSLAGLNAYANAALSGDKSSFTSFERRVTSIQSAIDVAKEKISQLGNTSVETDAFSKLKTEEQETEQRLASLKQMMDDVLSGKSDISDQAFKQLSDDISEAQSKLSDISAKQADLINTGQAYTDPLASYRDGLDDLQDKLVTTESEVRSAYNAMNNEKPEVNTKDSQDNLKKLESAAKKAKFALSSIGKGVTVSIKAVGSSVAALGKNLTGLKDRASNTTSTLKHGFRTILKYGLGIRSLYVLFRRLRTAIKDSFTELQKSGAMWQTTKANVEGLKTALSTLKFQFGAAFEPLFNTVAPAITAFINYLIDLMNTISAFIAKLTGRSTYSKVAKVMTNTGSAAGSAAKSTKELNKQLQAFDELNNISPENDSSGGGGSGGGGSSGGATYTEESVDSALGDFAKSLADAIEKGDWYKVGNVISTKLTEVLNNIPWPTIFQAAADFGKNFADFLNGLITPDLFSALGTTIGNAIKTKLTALNEFAKEFDWPNLGDSIAAGLKSFVDTHPLVLYAETFSNWVKGITGALATAINGALDNGTIQTISNDITEALKKIEIGEIAWNVGQIASGLANSVYTIVSNKETWSELGNKIGEGIDSFFKSMNKVNSKTGKNGWQALGGTISNSISGIATALKKALETVSWDEVGQAIADFINEIDWAGLAWDLYELAKTALGALCEAIEGFWENASWQSKIGGAIVGMIAVAKLTGLTGVIKKLLDKKLENETINTTVAGLALTVGGVAVMGADQSSENLEGLFHNAALAALGGVMIWKGLSYLKVPANIALKIAQIAFVWEFGTEVGKYVSQKLVNKFMDDGIISSEAGQEYINISNNGGPFGINWWIDIGESIFTGNFWDGWTNMWTDWLSPLFDEIALGWEALLNKCKSLWELFCDDLKNFYNALIKPWLDPLLEFLGLTKDVTEEDIDKSGGKKESNVERDPVTGKPVDTAGDTDATFNDVDYPSDPEKVKLYKHLVYDKDGNVIYGYYTRAKNSDLIYEEGDYVVFDWSFVGLGEHKVKIDADTDEALNKTDSLFNAINRLNNETVTINSKFKGDITNLKGYQTLLSIVTELTNKIILLKSLTLKITTDLNGDIENRQQLKETDEGIRNLKGALTSEEASYTIDVTGDVDNRGDIENLTGSFKNLRDGWKNKDATMNAKTAVDGKVGGGVTALGQLATDFETKLRSQWKDKDAYMRAKTEGIDKSKTDYKGLSDIWKDRDAYFTAKFSDNANTNSSEYKEFCKLWDNWYGTNANFTVSFDVSGNKNVENALANIVGQLNEALAAAGSNSRVDLNKVKNAYWGKAATGGILASATRLIAGEDGAEAIVPLEKNLGWLDKMSDMMITGMEESPKFGAVVSPPSTNFASNNYSGMAGNSQSDYLLEQLIRETQAQSDLLEQIVEKPSGITSDEVFRAVRTESKGFYNRTGSSPFNFGY